LNADSKNVASLPPLPPETTGGTAETLRALDDLVISGAETAQSSRPPSETRSVLPRPPLFPSTTPSASPSVHNNAPGYRGYYDSLYDEYFNSKVITDALKSDLYRTLSVDSYMFRIINLTNQKIYYS
jgi:hypothetical protein